MSYPPLSEALVILLGCSGVSGVSRLVLLGL